MNPLAPGRCIIYERVSTRRQVTQHVTDEVELCRQFAEMHSLPVIAVFIDAGATGFHGEREAYKGMLAYIREHGRDLRYILVPDFSRAWRNTQEYFSLRLTASKYGVTIISVRDLAVDQSPEGLAIEAALAFVATNDATVRKTLSVRAQERLVEAGLWPFRPPLGYLHGTPKGYLVPDARIASGIRRLFELVAFDGLSAAHAKAVELDLLGNGDQLSPARLRRILKNPLYAGRIALTSGFRCEAQFEPLVDGETFDAVQARLGGRSTGNRSGVPRLPLSRFVACSECGYFLSGSYAKGKYGWYRCKTGCSKIRATELHEAFIAFADALKSHDGVESKLNAIAAERAAEVSDVERIVLERDLERICDRKDQLIAWRQDQSLQEDEWLRRIGLERAREEQVLARLEDIAAASLTDAQRVEQVTAGILSRPGQVWKTLPVPLQRRLQDALFPEEVVLEFDELRTHAINPVFNGFGKAFTQVRTLALPSDRKLERRGRPWHRVPRVERERLSSQYFGDDLQIFDPTSPVLSFRRRPEGVAA